MTPVDPLALAEWLCELLDRRGIPYVIGGSVASSVLGEPRSTLDLDLMVHTDRSRLDALLDALTPTFHVDREAAQDALTRKAAFNAIEIATSMKVDFFFAENEFALDQIARAIRIELPSGASLRFYRPEDLVIRKLMWFRAGGEESDRQWRDVIGVLRSSHRELDVDLLQRLASQVGVHDLAERALASL